MFYTNTCSPVKRFPPRPRAGGPLTCATGSFSEPAWRRRSSSPPSSASSWADAIRARRLPQRDLNRGALPRDDARDDVEHALPRAPGDVLVQTRVAEVGRALARAQALLVRAERLREPDRRRRGIRRLAAERLSDPPRAVGVVERELPLHAGAEDGDVLRATRAGLGD